MSVPVTYTPIEWYALAGLARRSGLPALAEPDLPVRITNAVGRAWLARQKEVTLEVAARDAALLDSLRSELPDTEVLSAIAEAEQIVREHAWRPQT